MKRDTPTRLFSRLAHKVRLGSVYDKYTRFFNDQFVELIGLIIANTFVFVFSFYFIGLPLVLILLFVSTPITMVVKYVMRKYWVWKK